MPLRRYGAHWTPDEDDRLRELAGDGYAFPDIAAELGRTHNGVRVRACEIGVRYRGPSHWYKLERRTAVLDCIREGLTVKATAERLGLRQDWVCKLVQELVRKGLVRRTGRKRSLKLWAK